MRIAAIVACVLSLLVWDMPAWSQRGGHAGGGGGGRPSAGGFHGGATNQGSAVRTAPAPPSASSSVQGGRIYSVRPPAPPPAAAINPGFPSALGNNVGVYPLSPGTLPPGVGNINQPGLSHRRPPFPVNPPHGRPPFPGGFFNYPFLGFGPIFYGLPFTYFPFMGYPGYSSYMGYSVDPSSDSYPPE